MENGTGYESTSEQTYQDSQKETHELSVYHVGQRYVPEGRAFGLYLTSPPCNVELFPPKYEEDVKSGR